MRKLLIAIVCLVTLTGCGFAPFAAKEAVTEGLFIRRIVVGNDWVYVKRDNTLYKRYVPGWGIWKLRVMKGNPELLADIAPPQRPGFLAKTIKGPFDGKVVRWNKDIVVYGNLQKALNATYPQVNMTPDSAKYMPKEK
jgi:hypothetical protein